MKMLSMQCPTIEEANLLFSELLIEHLFSSGITHFCICPGSRNTPLSLAVARHPQMQSLVHFDERGAIFYSLGYALATKQAAAIIVTSGTALANLFPAIIEASESHIPLLILTADRPQELKNTQANQTIDQEKIYGNFVRFYASVSIEKSFSTSLVTQLVYKTISLLKYPLPGPCHLNLCFREPLVPKKPLSLPDFSPIIPAFPKEPTLSEPVFLSSQQRGLILIGKEEKRHLPAIFSLAKTLNWPIFSDILSQTKTETPPPHLLLFAEEFLSTEKTTPEIVLHFGERFVSPSIFSFLQKTPPSFYAHIYPHPTFYNPYSLVTHRFFSSSSCFCEKVILKDVPSTSKWWEKWLIKEDMIKTLLQEETAFQEPLILRKLGAYLPQNFSLFLGNSLPIRHARMLECNPKIQAIYANRGASGIDGNIATCIGISSGIQSPLIAILGDITALHDLNSFSLLVKHPYPIFFIILNNQGGSIFEHLPISFSPYRKTFFQAKHAWRFKDFAKAFSLPYLCIKKWEDMNLLSSLFKEKKSYLIEILTEEKSGTFFYKKLASTLLQSSHLQENKTPYPALK